MLVCLLRLASMLLAILALLVITLSDIPVAGPESVGVSVAQAHPSNTESAGQDIERWPATVVRVVDGDTVDVVFEDGTAERVRLIGLNTPETVDPRRPVQCFGREASARAAELLSNQAVMVELDASQGDRDQFGRLLAYVFLPDDSNVAEVLIAEGYAFEYTFRLPYRYQTEFQAAEAYARDNQLGLWAPDACTPSSPTAGDVPPYAGPFDPSGPDRDCGDFTTWEEAQAFYVAAGGPAQDPHRLDADGDGIVCETLPGAPG